MRLLYASSISYPSPYANRIQTLRTANALGEILGSDFCLAAADVKGLEGLYAHRLVNFGPSVGPLIAWKEMRYIRTHAYDTVFCREYSLLFLLILYDRFFFRSNTAFFYEEHFVPSRLPFRLRYVLRHCRGIVATAEAIADDLKKASRAPFLVVRNGVDASLFSAAADKGEARRRFNLPEKPPIALYAGSINIHGWKGTDTFVASREKLSAGSDVLYVLAGADQEMISPDAHIRFLPRMPQKDLAVLLRAADVLVLPNTAESETSRRYTSPVKLFEYMASGTPIVASDLPSIREIVDETMVAFAKPGNPGSLAQAIASVLADPAASAARAARAKEEVAQYSWRARAKRILDFIAK